MILCVEDNPFESSTIYLMLRMITQERAILMVPGRRKAIEMADRMIGPPVAILCDLLMEDNGYATIRWLRARYPRPLPIVVVSGVTDPGSAFEDGADAFVQKTGPGLSIRLRDNLHALGVEL